MKDVVTVHLAEGFEEIEAVSIIDVLRRADIETVVVSVSGKKEVTGSHNITLTADTLFEEMNYDRVGMIVLPGGMPGASHLKKHEALGKQIVRFHIEGKPLGAICAAPMVFGNLGILRGKKATCFPGFEEELKGADITGTPVVVADHIVTGKGAGVAIPFALSIVEMLKGRKESETLAERMIWSGTINA